MYMKSFLMFVGVIFFTVNVYAENSKTALPPDIVKFIEDREICDHFGGEPREFDREYLESGGEQAYREQAERAAFLQKQTEKYCTGMDARLDQLKREYGANSSAMAELDKYIYIEVEPTTKIRMHKHFPNAKLVEAQLKKVVWIIEWLDTDVIPARWTVQIGAHTDVATAQRIIKACLTYGAKDIGVEVLAPTPNSVFHYYYSVTVGGNVEKTHPVYEGAEIDKLLSAGLSQKEFDNFARTKEAYCPARNPDGSFTSAPCR
jgi:hypothetical protein